MRTSVRFLLIILTLLLWIIPLSRAAASQICPATIYLKFGDSLADIAQNCGTSVEALLSANPQIGQSKPLYAGETIAIPSLIDRGPVISLSTDQIQPGGIVDILASGLSPESVIEVWIAEHDGKRYRIKHSETDHQGSIKAGITVSQEAQPGEQWQIALLETRDGRPLVQSTISIIDPPLTYTVKRGDRLSRIASNFNTTVQDILEANPTIKNPDRIFVGQVIAITDSPVNIIPQLRFNPTSGPAGAHVRLQASAFPADASIILGFGRLDAEFELFEEIQTNSDGSFEITISIPEEVEVGEELVVHAFVNNGWQTAGVRTETYKVIEVPESYTVEKGDSLGKIASRFGVPLYALLHNNPEIIDARKIYPGQILNIPGPDYDFTSITTDRLEDWGINVGESERWIDVNLSTQTVHAYEGQNLVRTFIVSTGTARTPTVTGKYRIYVKYKFADMRGPGYHLRDVPSVMYFYKGYGFHGTYWHNNFGTPMSHGCVNLTIEDAAWLFDFSSVGILVNIHY
jgi:LysM repeat protein